MNGASLPRAERAVALCQCPKCERYLAVSRDPNSSRQYCQDCALGGLPLAEVRACLTDPLDVEIVGLLTEEAGEISQRVGKILRWGWKADFEGTTQQHKLETELGDMVAMILLAHSNGVIHATNVVDHALAKIAALRVDAAGPRQRLQVARVPVHHDVTDVLYGWGERSYCAGGE